MPDNGMERNGVLGVIVRICNYLSFQKYCYLIFANKCITEFWDASRRDMGWENN